MRMERLFSDFIWLVLHWSIKNLFPPLWDGSIIPSIYLILRNQCNTVLLRSRSVWCAPLKQYDSISSFRYEYEADLVLRELWGLIPVWRLLFRGRFRPNRHVHFFGVVGSLVLFHHIHSHSSAIHQIASPSPSYFSHFTFYPFVCSVCLRHTKFLKWCRWGTWGLCVLSGCAA
jgi:hypothetical protein